MKKSPDSLAGYAFTLLLLIAVAVTAFSMLGDVS